jgi:hypothetical protein
MRRRAWLAGAVAAVAALTACGGGDGSRHAAPAARAWNGTLGGVPLQRANCTAWHGAGATQRGQAVRALSATIGGASTSGGVGTTLPDGDVAALFDRVCGTPGTSSFVLYLIYARAAAFSHQHNGPTPITAPPASPGV